jgi:hypothetical protein
MCQAVNFAGELAMGQDGGNVEGIFFREFYKPPLFVVDIVV